MKLNWVSVKILAHFVGNMAGLAQKIWQRFCCCRRLAVVADAFLDELPTPFVVESTTQP